MQKLLIYFNCHGDQISHFLKLSPTCASMNIVHISAYKKRKLSPEDIENIKTSDFLIIQHIENERKHTHKTILSHKKEGAKYVILPHYRTSIYDYHLLLDNSQCNQNSNGNRLPEDLAELLTNKNASVEEKIFFANKFNGITINSQEKINNHIQICIDDFIKLENNSSIKMSDFFIENFRKYRLFGSRSYPRPFLFYHITKKILEYWGIFDINGYEPYHLKSRQNWYHTVDPLPQMIKKEFGLEFEENNILCIMRKTGVRRYTEFHDNNLFDFYNGGGGI